MPYGDQLTHLPTHSPPRIPNSPPPPPQEKVYIIYDLRIYDLYQVPMAPSRFSRTETLDIYLFGPIPICTFYTECSDKIGPDPSIFAYTGPKEKRLN